MSYDWTATWPTSSVSIDVPNIASWQSFVIAITSGKQNRYSLSHDSPLTRFYHIIRILIIRRECAFYHLFRRAEIPRDRHSTFEPQIIPKHQTRWAGFDEKILSLYARGMTVREIQSHLEEIYGTEVSPSLISSVTDAVAEEVKTWQARPLDLVYPIVYLDCIHVKIREGAVRVKAVYLAIGVTMSGEKEVLGLWLSQTEGAKFWLQVVTELRNRGVQDIFIACVDGLKGFPDAIEAVFPKAVVQSEQCSLKFRR